MQQIPLSLDQARDRGALGMHRAADRANRNSHAWVESAVAALLAHIQTIPRNQAFILEDVRLAIEHKLEQPTDLRAWGAVTQRAIRVGYIYKTGDSSPARSSNHSPKPLYRRGALT